MYWRTELVTGRHRLEAVRMLGHKSILAMVIEADDTKARLLEISENLHRAELSALDRNLQIAEWIRLEVSSSLAETSREGRPGIIAEAARSLPGVSESAARRAVKVEGITDEAREALRASGLDKNQSVLLEIASYGDEDQVEEVERIAKAKCGKAKRKPVKVVAPKRKSSATITLGAHEYAVDMPPPSALFASILANLDAMTDDAVREFSRMLSDYISGRLEQPQAVAA